MALSVVRVRVRARVKVPFDPVCLECGKGFSLVLLPYVLDAVAAHLVSYSHFEYEPY